MLCGLRPVLRAGVSRWWDLHVHRQDLAPVDGPVLAICAPRPVHALTKREMFDGRTSRSTPVRPSCR